MIAIPIRPAGHRTGWWRRRLTVIAVAAGLVIALGGAGYAFVLKSFPYQTPQDSPLAITLRPSTVAEFVPYASGLADVPVLTWRDVSHRLGVLVTTPNVFATQLAVLRQEGYESISLRDLEAVADGRPVSLPGRPVVLAFDDGLSTDWTTVDPVLQRYGFRAVVFVNPADLALKSPSYFLTGSELSAMASSGRWDIGLDLPGGWQSGPKAAVAAARARNQLEGAVGHHVTAFGWSSLKYPTTQAKREPLATYAAFMKQFAVVFGRPVGGQASFVVSGSANGPLPRIAVTAKDTLQSLSLRLRTGVQGPPPHDLLSLPWQSPGGRCLVTPAMLKVTGARFALCTVLANGARWADYSLHFAVAGTTGDTAVVELRASSAGCLEIAFGRNELSIKQRIGRRWSLLRQITFASGSRVPGTMVSSASPALIGGRTLRVGISLTESTLWLEVRGVSIRQQLSPRVQTGVVALGLVGRGKPTVLTFRQITVIRNS